MAAGKGLPFIGKLGEYLDRVLHPTVQKAGNSRAALDVINRGYYLLNINAYVVEAGSNDNIVKLTAHPFREGDSVRLYVTANPIKEQEITIDEIIDANTFKLAGYLSASLTTGDTFYCRRPTAELLAEDGTRLASLSYMRDNIAVPVKRDTVTPANSTALPVEIMGANGMVLNVTTGDLAIQSFHQDRVVNSVNIPGDSIRIGDGTTLAGVTLSSELKTSDALALAKLTTMDGNLTDIEALSTAGNASLSSIDTKLTSQATAANQASILAAVQAQATLLQTQPVSIATMPSTPVTNINLDAALSTRNAEATQLLVKAKTDNLDVALSTVAKDATLLASNVLLGSVIEVAPATNTASSGINGRLQRIAQNISAMILQLPATLGIKNAAASLSIAPASDAKFIVKTSPVGLSENQGTVSIAATVNGPANAVSFIIQAFDTNTANIRLRNASIGAASASLGFQLQPGRSETFEGVTDVSLCSEVGTNGYIIFWKTQA